MSEGSLDRPAGGSGVEQDDGRSACADPSKQGSGSEPRASHTPGPWIYDGHSPGMVHAAVPVCDGNTLVASVYGADPNCHADDLMRANARLIAAAPTMYAAIGPAITALAFAQERAAWEKDGIALAQITAAKNGLIAAHNAAMGRDVANMIDITPRSALSRAVGETK